MSLSDVSIKNPVFAWMLMSALIIFGLICYGRLGISQLPDVDFPVVSVSLSWEGAAPEIMETDVVDVVEDSVMSIQGVRDVSSSIRQGLATVTIEFELKREIDAALLEIQTKIEGARRLLPKDLDPPVVTKVNPEDQPILWIALSSSSLPLRDLMSYVQDHFKDQFTTISGVGEIFMGGFLERNLRLWVDADKLNEHELTVQDVVDAVREQHQEVPAGRLETESQERNIRVMGEAIDTGEFAALTIARRAGGPVYRPVYLRDVATVEDGMADLRRLSRTMGRQSVGLGIRKQRGANEVLVAKHVLRRLEEVKRFLPAGIEAQVVFNRTKFSEDSIHELIFTLLLSAIATSIVCWIFLGSFGATFNVLLAIPTSILGTFIVIYFLGFTLNTFTVLGLSLAIGIVVDDAIMVLENIVRYREEGEGRLEAARRGTRQITPAALAATVALIAIFLPVAFMAGVIGRFFYQFGVVISAAIALSLLEALTLTPMRCSQFLQAGRRKTYLGRQIELGFQWAMNRYRTLLARALKRQAVVIISAIALFFGTLWFLRVLRKEFLPPQDQSMFLCRLQTPVGSSIDYTNEKFKQAEEFIMKRPELRNYFCVIGGFGGGEVNSGALFVTFKPPRERPIVPPNGHPLSQGELMALFRRELNQIPDVRATIQDLSLSGFSAQRGFPIELSIQGPDWDRLAEYSERARERMARSPLMIDVDTNYLSAIPEIRILPDRRAAESRMVSIEAIGDTVDALIGGKRIGKYTRGGRRYDVRIRLVPSQRRTSEDIERLWVWNNRGELVQLKDVVKIEQEPRPLTITRRNRERSISIFANVAPGKSQADAIAEVNDIARETLPEGYRAVFTGSTQTARESFASLIFVLLLGILVAYMVLASQFNSYIHPISVLFALPFSISGALIALWAWRLSLNVYSLIGLILLMGIVKKNSILLVDFTNQMRAGGMEAGAALLKACPIRLRPILMTSISTVAAAIPPALALGPGAEARIPMAVTIIGGVAFSTLLSLFVVPCAYNILSKLERKRGL